MKIEIKDGGINATMSMLNGLPPALLKGPVSPLALAVRQGALVILKQAHANFRAAVAMPGKSGITVTTGFTEKQIVLRHKLPPSGEIGERYIITVSPKPHPSAGLIRRKSRVNLDLKSKRRTREGPAQRAIAANDIAFMMEFGTSSQPATPWLRPAFAQTSAEAIAIIEHEIVKAVAKIAAEHKG